MEKEISVWLTGGGAGYWGRKFDYDEMRDGADQTTILQEVTEETNCNIHFIKLHAPWSLLCTYAEELNLRAPLQVSGWDRQNRTERIEQ